MKDAFDKFAPPERGRFGDNEAAPERAPRPRVNGASNLKDLDLVLHHQTEKALLVSTDGTEAKAQWLPKSSIEFEIFSAPYVMGTLKTGQRREMARVEVTLPEWLAKQKGLI